jgi:eukaryotic-like serine/threonine-protein kinase
MKVSQPASSRDHERLAEAVEKQLNRLLESQLFSSSPRHQALLRTIIKESLEGRTDALKEIVLAKEVFGRPDYDPKRHTLVRVEVNAVRRKLAEYYSRPGRDDQVRIDIPPGHYLAVFSSLHGNLHGGFAARKAWYAVAGVAMVLIAIPLFVLATWHSHAAAAPVPVQITFDTGETADPAVSRDGSVVVYTSDRGPRGNTDIWIQEAGKALRQLTDDPAHDISPDISPDGKRVVFRSWRKEEGIWWVPAAGGEPKLLVKGGYVPRFSPDGKRIAFTAQTNSAGHIFVMPADGGVPEQLDYGIDEANCPVWSPDGSEVAFVGQAAAQGKYDLWTAKTWDSRDQFARPLGVQAKLRAQSLPPITAFNDCPQDWVDDRLLFVTHQHDVSFLLQAELRSGDRLSDIRALPFGLGANGVRAVHAHGRLSILFAPERRQTNIWGYNFSRPGNLEQLTQDNTLIPGTWPALSGHGNLLAFITERAGSPDICLKNLHSGAEQLLGASPASQGALILNEDGSEIVFERKQASVTSVILRNLRDNRERVVTKECPSLQDWSVDGKLLLCTDHVDLFEISIGTLRKTVVLHPPREPGFARFSPDARWVSYVSTAGQGEIVVGYLAPLDGSDRTIQIDREVYTLSLHWAPDGNAIYYWSVRDGFRCLYMQRLDPRTKVPKGEPIAILHRHGSQHYPWSGGTLAVSSNVLAFTLTDELANVWKVDLPR